MPSFISMTMNDHLSITIIWFCRITSFFQWILKRINHELLLSIFQKRRSRLFLFFKFYLCSLFIHHDTNIKESFSWNFLINLLAYFIFSTVCHVLFSTMLSKFLTARNIEFFFLLLNLTIFSIFHFVSSFLFCVIISIKCKNEILFFSICFLCIISKNLREIRNVF